MWPRHIYCLPEAASPPRTLCVFVFLCVYPRVPVRVRVLYVAPSASAYIFQVHLGAGLASCVSSCEKGFSRVACPSLLPGL